MESRSSTRKSTPRSRNGCTHCRLKKVKCGEELPSCARCVRYGSQCIYAQNVGPTKGGTFSTFAVKRSGPPVERNFHKIGPGRVNWQDMAIRSRESSFSSSPETTTIEHNPWESPSPAGIHSNLDSFPRSKHCISIPTAPPLLIPGTQDERHIFHYLCIRVLPDTGGSTNHTFWRVAVLSLYHKDPVVRSAALSLGSFHRAKNSESHSHDLKSLQQYHFALQAARNYLNNRTEPFDGLLLIICLLFYCIETTRGEYEAATKHALAGLKVLRSWQYKDRTRDISNSKKLGVFNDISNRLTRVFSSLDTTMSNTSNFTRPHLVLTSPNERAGMVSCVPMAMNGLLEAAGSFSKLTNWSQHFLASITSITPPLSFGKLPIALRNELSYLMKDMEIWETSVIPLISPNNPWEKLADIAILKVIFLKNKVMFHRNLACFTSSSLLIDVHHQFSQLLDLVNMMTDWIAKYPQAKQHIKPSLFMSGILAPLSFVGITCRPNDMRQRAVKLLKLWPVNEGIYDGKKFARALEKAMYISEQATLEQDDHEARLSLFRTALIGCLKQETGVSFPASSVFTFPA